MRRYRKFTVVLTVFFIIMGLSGEFTVQADEISGNSLAEGIAEAGEDDTSMPVETEDDTENVGKPDSETQMPAMASEEPDSGTQMPAVASEEPDSGAQMPAVALEEPDSGTQMPAAALEGPTEPPAFQAKVEWSNQGWIVKGCFQDMTSDTILVQPMCSTDGEIYDDCGQEWSLEWLSFEEESVQEKVRNQRCLFASEEPFKSYLDKDLDRFFIKLRVVREGGITLETQPAVIERKEMQPEPAEVELIAKFAPCVLVREGRPPTMRYYGRYQMTVREDATMEEIAASLPDTLPVEVGVYRGTDIVGSDIVDCPVRWKALEPTQLTAGESVTLLDATEEIVVPAGTVLHTQTGIYRVEEPLSLYQYRNMTDEVRLILNVVAKDGQPKGALAGENHGLEITFSLKPTGARAIHAYFFREGDTAWTEIKGLSLIDLVNDQPSTANSGYAVVLGREQEPLLSYNKAVEAGEEPLPFCVGVKVEGGVYDGGQLVLAWPDTYERPLQLPQMGGSGGNEGNAGSDDKDDGTEEGQRPGLPGEEPDQPLPEEPSKPTEEPSEPSDQQPSEPSKEESSDPPKKQSKPSGKQTKPSTEQSSEPPKEQSSEPPTEQSSEPPKEQSSEPSTEQPSGQPTGQSSEPPTEQPSEPSKKQPQGLLEEKENQILAAEDSEPAGTLTNRETEGHGKGSVKELSEPTEKRTDQQPVEASAGFLQKSTNPSGFSAALPAAVMAVSLAGGAAAWRVIVRKGTKRRKKEAS